MAPITAMEENDIRKKLTEEEYHVLRERGTERPFSGKYHDSKRDGKYACKACGNVLFDSETKFDSGTGWPSFDRAVKGSVEMREDRSHGAVRTEVVCAKCKSHLGHVFGDGPASTGNRFCINSVCLNFRKRG